MGKAKSVSTSKLPIVAALLIVYIFWGGTYLGMKIATESVPPFFMAGMRFFIAGLIIGMIAVIRKTWHATREEVIHASLVGILLLLLGNGGVAWASRIVPSYVSSILVAASPVWMILLNWMFWSLKKPSYGVLLGMLIGLSGIVIMVVYSGSAEQNQIAIPFNGALVLIISSICWATGSLYSRYAKMPKSMLTGLAIQMISGGIILLLASFLTEDIYNFNFSVISIRSWWAFLYLIICGSLLGYSAYIWLMKNAEPSVVSTYAFVNPIVAVFIGWIIADEPLTVFTFLSAIFIIVAVIIITFSQKKLK